MDEAILEAVALDRLGVTVPIQARTAALMAPQLRSHQEGLTAMIDHYHKVSVSAQKPLLPIHDVFVSTK